MKKIIKGLKATIGRNLNNIPGWRTNRKIVVLESDDWGSIRMPSRGIYNQLLAEGWKVDKCSFSRYDSLASESDLSSLFGLLTRHRDVNGRHPVLTANTIVANPDFEKIRKAGFTQYFYEPFTETLKKYPEHSNSYSLMKQGITAGIYHPQLHGREHTYVKRWMQYLQAGHKMVRRAFDLGMADVLNGDLMRENSKNYREAFDCESYDELEGQGLILEEAQNLFVDLFGFSSDSFIAPNYVWTSRMEPGLQKIGVKYLQSFRGQVLPCVENSEKKIIKRYVGDRNDLGQLYLVRNCIFEPTDMPYIDSVAACLKQVETSFFWNKPAIISTHRLNYIGYIDEANRKQGLNLLNDLLTKIIKKWPDVEFMTSNELGDLIAGEEA